VNTIAAYSANNRMAGTTQVPAGVPFDASGDVLNDGATQYLYDAEGRICASANTPSPGLTTMTGYIYDADGLRVAKGAISTWSCDPTVSGFTTISDYVLGPGGEQVTEMGAGPSGALAWQHTNVWAAGKLLATYDNDGLHFYLDDPLGTRRAQTDYAGVLEQTCSSWPFGDGFSCGGATHFPTEHFFTGKERDAESGLDYFGARYYSSSLARFMSPDWSAKVEPVPYSKLDDPQTLNLYAYVNNNPLISLDPDGHGSTGGLEVGIGGLDDWLKQHAEQVYQAAQQEVWLFSGGATQRPDALVSKPPPAPRWAYQQSTGTVSLKAGSDTVVTVGKAYSGHGKGLNSPDSQATSEAKDKQNAGPIPQGNYTIGKQQLNTTGSGTQLPGSMRLTPDPGNTMFGRGGFLIHGDNSAHNSSASEGCIVAAPAIRNQIGGSGVSSLEVEQ
jgi:RHS repeat-associated protein